LATFRCPAGGLTKQLRSACASLLLNLNLVMDPGDAVALAERALRLAFEQQGQALPALDDGAAAGGSGTSGSGGSSSGSEGTSSSGGGGGRRIKPRAPPRRPGLLRRLQTEGGSQVLLVGVVLGSLAPLGLHAAGRLIRRRR
jgi:hypothetical protein